VPAYRIHDVLPKIRERAERDLGRAVNADELHAIAVATIRELDMHVNGAGEIIPSAPMHMSIPEQKPAYWRGGRNRR
jgi:hypothetical protein